MTSQGKKERDDDALAAEYALGVLPHDERVRFQQRLLSDEKLMEKVDWWNNQLVPLSDEIESVAPGANVLDKIESRLFTSHAQKSGWWENIGLWRGLTVVCLAGMLILGGLYSSTFITRDESARVYIGELSDAASELKLAAYYDEASQTLRLNRLSGTALPERSLELWIIPDGQSPISLGVLPTIAKHEIQLPKKLHEAISAHAVLAVTDEPEGGSPTGGPTGAVLAAGSVLQI